MAPRHDPDTCQTVSGHVAPDTTDVGQTDTIGSLSVYLHDDVVKLHTEKIC